MKISATTWNTISKLLDEALDLEPNARTGWLERLQATEPQLASSVQQLLAAHATSETADVLAGLPPIEDLTGTFAEQKGDLGLNAGDRVGPYLLKRELGAGGMADVWLAERADGAFERNVALKLPRINRLRRDLAIRFARERDILARLEHPHIARLYDAGVTDDGLPYLAMEFVDGQPITDYCDKHDVPIKARLELFAQVLDAVQFAHANLIIHRDLKPSNILVGNDGRVRLLDFGIAKLLADAEPIAETQLTQLSGRALTPDYASPEQIKGEPLTTASDVYSLGVVLYELLAGVRPYRLKLATPAQLEQAIIDSEPTLPSLRILQETRKESRHDAKRRAKAVAGDLDTITMKALQKNTGSRYISAGELALELKRYIAFEPIQARRERRWYAFKKFVRRNQFAVAGSAALMISLSAGLIGTLWQANLAEQAVVLAKMEAQRASAEASAREREAARANNAASEAILQSKNAQEATRRANTSLSAAVEARARESRAAQIALVAERGAKEFAAEATRQRDAATKQTTVAKSEAARAEEVKTFILSLLGEAGATTGGVRGATLVDLLKNARSRFDAAKIEDPSVRIELLNVIGSGFRSQGELQLASTVLAEALQASRISLGDQHATTAEIRIVYANVLMNVGDTKNAAQQYDAAETYYRKVSNWRELVSTLRGQANLQSYAGNLDRAIEILLEGVRIGEQQVNATSSNLDKVPLVTVLTDLSARLREKGGKGSLEYGKRAFELAQETEGGKTTVFLLEAKSAYLAALVAEGDAEVALVEMKSLLRQQIELLGLDNIQIAITEGRLAAIYLRRGEPLQAVESLRDATRIYEAQSAGKPSNPLAVLQGQLANAFANARQHEEAYAAWMKADRLFSALRSADDSAARMARSGVGKTLVALGRLDEADAIFASILQTPSRSPSEKVIINSRLALLRSAQGRHDEARSLLQDAPSFFSSSSNLRNRGLAFADLGAVLLAKGLASESLDVMRKAQSILLSIQPNGSPDLAEVALNIARAQLEIGNPQQAVVAARQANEFWTNYCCAKRESGLSYLWLSRSLNMAGDSLGFFSAWKEADRILGEVGREDDRALLAQIYVEGQRTSRSRLQ